jgi:hypothetical protein
MPKLKSMTQRKQELEAELDRLVDRRSLCKTQAETLKLIPEAVKITGAIQRIEREIESASMRSNGSLSL